ncbi:hypothetical protein [Paenibacillus hubeiensis]|uniref:hypothetical protein n=1 Tax=Paenibacillus hubeiensis TaxID=3077330 RepID=UPI0031BBB48F
MRFSTTPYFSVFRMAPVLALVLFMTACTSYTKVSSEGVKAFRQDIKQNFPLIQKTEIRYSTPRVEVTYKLKEELNEAEVQLLFTKTQAFMTSPSFQSEVIDGQYRIKYPSWGDPELAITLTVRGEDAAVYRFICMPENVETDKDEPVYTHWYVYTEDDAEGKPYPDQKTEIKK